MGTSQAQPQSQPPVTATTAKPSITPPTPPATQTPGPPPATPAPTVPAKIARPTLQDLLAQFIQVKPVDNTSSHFTHEGICTKCGWHTLQLSEADARVLLTQHVQQHWKLVANQL